MRPNAPFVRRQRCAFDLDAAAAEPDFCPPMMMAHDSTPSPAALAEETVDAVRVALAQYIDDTSRADQLRSALHAMAAEARAKSILPEQLLVGLKDVWYALPNVRAMTEQTEQVRLLQRVVTMCIKEYYAD
jgi:hypothetical protein